VAAAPKPDLRALVAGGAPVSNAWLGLGLPFVIELIADAGWQAVSIDQQHGQGDQTEMLACLAAARGANVPALVRVPAYDFGLIGRALDAGAQGVVVPMVETAEHAARLVNAVKYPPVGGRSFGPYRARLMVEGDYFDRANVWTIACGQIETKLAVDNIDEILSVPGFDMVYLGPNDLAISMSNGRERNLRAPEVLEAIELVRRKCVERGVLTSIFANDTAYARDLIERGWQIVSVGTDANWLAGAARQVLQEAIPARL
jgi:4-hydroxy-2-oxoheptanedioate aldolase